MKRLNIIDWVALILTIIGSLNWGLIAVFHVNLVERIFGNLPHVANVIYIIVGIAAIYLAIIAVKLQKCD